MFYPECELLVLDKPDLERQIIKIDIYLYKVGNKGVIRPKECAKIIEESFSQVSGILQALHEYELINKVAYFECPECGNLILPEDFDDEIEQYGKYECSQCLRTFKSSLQDQEIIVYELNPSKMPEMKLFKDVEKPFKVFYSYAHEDEKLREELEKHLSPLRREGLIEDWHDRRLLAGSHFGTEINGRLKESHMILLLISSDFFSSNYCYSIEMQYAMAKDATKEMRVVPIILRECDWTHAPFAELLALPTDGKAVTSKAWNDKDEAFAIVAKGIRAIVSGDL